MTTPAVASFLSQALDAMEVTYGRVFANTIPTPTFLDSMDDMVSNLWEKLKAEPMRLRQRAIVGAWVAKFQKACEIELSKK